MHYCACTFAATARFPCNAMFCHREARADISSAPRGRVARTILSTKSKSLSRRLSTECLACTRRATLACITLSPLLAATSLLSAQAAFVDEDTAMSVFQKVAPSVVTVEDYTVVQGRETSEGVGSGFVWSKLGHIVTNYHCISKVIRDQTGKSVCHAERRCKYHLLLLPCSHYCN